MTPAPPYFISASDEPAFRQLLDHIASLGYNETQVRDLLGLVDLSDLQWRALPIHRMEHLIGRDVLALAIDLLANLWRSPNCLNGFRTIQKPC